MIRQFGFTWTAISWLLMGYGLFFALSPLQAQTAIKKFSLELKNESLPEALKQLEKAGGKNILFTYNGTESYRVTVSIREKTEREAIDLVLAGKPFLCIEREEYFVVQRKKSDKAIAIAGKVYDEKGVPLPFVNILALAADSSFLAGSVTEEDGSFHLPPVAGEDCLLKATYIGYRPQIIPCRQQNTIRLQPDTELLKEVVVTASRPLIERKDGTLTANIAGTPLSLMGSAKEMISHLPFVTGSDGEFTVLGRGTPEIYINGRKVRDKTELDRLQANEILSAEIITTPGVQYGSSVGAVIRLRTIRKRMKEAIAATKKFVTEKGIGRVKVNYRLRDAIFSRQRYWGEPFPVYYKDGMPQMVPEECLPLELPEIETYKPTETGEPPLGRAKKWAWDAEKKEVVDKSLVDNKTVFPLELNTMPGFAGSSAYYLRYMDPHNDEALVGKEADEYWQNVDLYVGGCEHATGHLIYSRFWNKFLFDLGVSCKEEPFQKLVNQGMIQGRSNFVYRINSDDHDKAPVFVSLNLKKDYDVTPIHVDVNIVSNDVLDIEAFKAWRPEYQNAEFILEDGKYICGWAIEKMSKSMFNVVNPDMIVEKYGADTLRLYEMFLGPVEASKPWDTNGIDGCHRFLKKFWGLFYENRTDNFLPSADEAAKPESLKSVHKLIKKVSEDIEKFSYNTSISAFMIAVNELGQQKCRNKELLTDLVILIAPFAPHIAEELWAALGEQGSVCDAAWPKYDEQYLKENDMQLTISFNGKARFQMTFPVDTPNEEIQKQVLEDEKSQKYLEGFNVLKVIIVPKKIVNVVLKK